MVKGVLDLGSHTFLLVLVRLLLGLVVMLVVGTDARVLVVLGQRLTRDESIRVSVLGLLWLVRVLAALRLFISIATVIDTR